ncbi:hypothetical protein QBC34DRAFT_382530 [Podospora aff. communis PSN243]|uniref:C2H2-type domain-containing protein n=1 Tax=Podospora aff. communis PSN243 TaxID=3040156 RepID=A0AAV9GFP1_9PEZI|nr:hypothetical protein QBC34DRAFT_382530 [Podospora aff. communis PSN243]
MGDAFTGTVIPDMNRVMTIAIAPDIHANNFNENVHTNPGFDMTNANINPNPDIISVQLADGTWRCAISTCNQTFKHHQELSRHHKSTRQQLQLYLCRSDGCERAIRGFARKDKRKDHEKVVHGSELADVNGGV